MLSQHATLGRACLALLLPVLEKAWLLLAWESLCHRCSHALKSKSRTIILHTLTLIHSFCFYYHPSQNYKKKLKFAYLFHIFRLSYLPDFLVSSLTCSITLMSVLQKCIQHFELFLHTEYLPFAFRLCSCCWAGKYFHVISFSFLLFQQSFAILWAESVHSSGAAKVLISFLSPDLSVQTCLLTVPSLQTFISLLSTGLFLILFYFLRIFCLKKVNSDSFLSKCIQRNIFIPHISSRPIQVGFVSEILDRYFTSMTDISGFISLHQKYSQSRLINQYY